MGQFSWFVMIFLHTHEEQWTKADSFEPMTQLCSKYQTNFIYLSDSLIFRKCGLFTFDKKYSIFTCLIIMWISLWCEFFAFVESWYSKSHDSKSLKASKYLHHDYVWMKLMYVSLKAQQTLIINLKHDL